MSPELMKEKVLRAMTEGFNTGYLSVIDEVLHDDYTRHGYPGYPGCTSLAEHKSQILKSKEIFADSKFVVHDIVAEGTTVAARLSIRGRHVGRYFGIEPTGKEISREVAVFFKFRGDKVSESHAVLDIHGTLLQLREKSTP